MPIWNPRTRVERLQRARPRRPAEPDLPPGQYLTEKFPVLTFGSTPDIDTAQWRLQIRGAVQNPFELDWPAFQKLPRKKITADIHCVTRWSLLHSEWEGVPLQIILEMAAPLPDAVAVMQHAYGGYTTNLRLDLLQDPDILLADTFSGEPLGREHGGPLRLVVPKLYFWKSAKWLNGLEFLTQDAPGFWEKYGYHMRGDPWLEQRFGEPGDAE